MVSNFVAWAFVFLLFVSCLSLLVLVSWNSSKPEEAFRYAIRILQKAFTETKGLKLSLPKKQPLEHFLKSNWRTLILVGLLLFSFFVWPTQYRRSASGNGQVLYRENRINGSIEKRSVYEDKWEKAGRY